MKVTLEFADEFDNSEDDLIGAMHIEDGKTRRSAASVCAAIMASGSRPECMSCILEDDRLSNNEKIVSIICAEQMIDNMKKKARA